MNKFLKISMMLVVFGASALKGTTVEENMQTLKKTNACKGCDLSGADLAGFRLVGTDLTGANLKSARLRNIFWNGAIIHDADVEGADFTGVKVLTTTGVRYLSPGDLSGAKNVDKAKGIGAAR